MWHPDQQGEWVNGPEGNQWRLSFPYGDLREVLMDVLKHGDHVQVLAPESLRNAVHSACHGILSRDGGW